MAFIPTKEEWSKIMDGLKSQQPGPHTYVIPEELLDQPSLQDILKSQATIVIVKNKNASSTR